MTRLTSKLTEPLWSVSNALNRKCAYVEASAERTHIKARLKKRVLKGRFFFSLINFKEYQRCIRRCFFLSFLVKEENTLLQAKTLEGHYGQRSAFLLSEEEISKPLNVLPLVLSVPSSHDNENQKYSKTQDLIRTEERLPRETHQLALNDWTTQTSLWEKLWVDFFKGFLIDDSTGALLKDNNRIKQRLKHNTGIWKKRKHVYFSLSSNGPLKKVSLNLRA